MTSHDAEFLELLRSTFRIEAAEHLQAIAGGLLELEAAPVPDPSVIERVFRSAHTLKGAARVADFTEIEGFCQSMEDMLADWKRGRSAPTPESLDSLHRALDAMNAALEPSAPPAAQRVSEAPSPRAAVPAEPSRPSGPIRDQPPEATAATKAPVPIEVTVRVAVGKLESQLLKAEEILTAKLTAAQRAADLRDLAQHFDAWRAAWSSIDPDLRELRQSGSTSGHLTRVLDFLDWTLHTMRAIEDEAVTIRRSAEQDRHSIGKLVGDLLGNSKELLLLPFSTISAPFPKLVRDLSRDQGKEAELRVHGDDVQIDKQILEEIKDPIVHLLRNSVDHGIEMPEERLRQGKPARALITIELSRVDGDKVQLVLSDDGAGIDHRKVRDAAIRQGVITAEEAERLSDAEAQLLVFRSDVTTSRIITELSGRGLGLAIVQEKAIKLGGEVSVESRPGTGTTFRIVLPSTRATFRGVFVEAGGQLMVIPTSQVERVGRTRAEDIRTVQGRDTVPFEGHAVPLVSLAEVLEIPAAPRTGVASAPLTTVIAGGGDHRVAFVVDAILDEQEVLVKPLRAPLVRVRNIAGATILGSGVVAPILNVADLVKSARKSPSATTRAAASAHAALPARSILVAEDSITSRMLLKSILESAGFKVKTAIDGMEAYAILRAEHFDLVVSDVEMPRLSGFDLTARIRADQKLKDLPVVLVTALETREDKERGVDAGANAYIVKGSFDQSNLLDAVRRLI